MKIYFIANGPGEIVGWLYPLVQWIREYKPFWSKYLSYYLILNPCQFASGEEERVVRTWEFFEEIFLPDEYWKLFKFKEANSIIFHIGGDLFFNLALAKKWKSKSLAYLEKDFYWEKFYNRIYASKVLKYKKAVVVGDLRFDFLPNNGFSNNNRIALFPGSRTYGLRFYLPFYFMLANEILKDFLDLKFTLFFSPFLNPSEKEKILEKLKPLWKDLPIEFRDLKDMREVNGYLLAITLPGTNTLQLAYMKIPMLVILPLHRPEYLPLEGIGNLVKGRIRDFIIRAYLNGNPYLALPNKIYPGVVPEIVGKFSFKDVLEFLKRLIDNREMILNIHNELKEKFNKDYLSSELIWKDFYHEILEKTI
jgi:lipid-A-disaccharide synthase